MSYRGIQSKRSTNCMSLVDGSKWIHSGSVTSSPTNAPTSAIHRATAASRSRPTARTARPATIGTQMARERYGMCVVALGTRPPRQQREEADDHGERVVVDVPRLEVAQQRRGPADDL